MFYFFRSNFYSFCFFVVVLVFPLLIFFFIYFFLGEGVCAYISYEYTLSYVALSAPNTVFSIQHINSFRTIVLSIDH